jgi:Skp family chaperone for outer membrane proteins
MAGKLTPQAENDLRVQGTRKEREYQRQGEDLQQDVDRERNDIIQKSGRQMREIINKLAVDKGMDVIVDSANTLYFKNALELTADAIAAYDAAYPTK